jgi:hypothetical protein
MMQGVMTMVEKRRRVQKTEEERTIICDFCGKEHSYYDRGYFICDICGKHFCREEPDSFITTYPDQYHPYEPEENSHVCLCPDHKHLKGELLKLIAEREELDTKRDEGIDDWERKFKDWCTSESQRQEQKER